MNSIFKRSMRLYWRAKYNTLVVIAITLGMSLIMMLIAFSYLESIEDEAKFNKGAFKLIKYFHFSVNIYVSFSVAGLYTI